jgi:hypothetical protein
MIRFAKDYYPEIIGTIAVLLVVTLSILMVCNRPDVTTRTVATKATSIETDTTMVLLPNNSFVYIPNTRTAYRIYSDDGFAVKTTEAEFIKATVGVPFAARWKKP